MATQDNNEDGQVIDDEKITTQTVEEVLDEVDGNDVELDEEAAGEEQEKVEPPPAEANWVKELRNRQKEVVRENRLLKDELNRLKAPEKNEAIPAKPKLSDDGIDYDEEKFSTAMESYTLKKANIERAQNAKKEATAAVFTEYQKKAAALAVEDYKDAEAEVVAELSDDQQSIILEAAINPAAVVYKLYESPEKLAELKAIKSLPKFAAAIGIMEKDMKPTTTQKPKPPPEGVVRGGTTTSGASLEALRQKAQKTGDFAEYHAAMRKK